MTHKYLKMYSTLTIREIEIKTTLRFFFTLVRMAHVQKINVSLILPRAPGTKDWIVQRPRIEAANINEMIPNDIVLTSWTGAQHNHHQRAFIQKLIDTNLETHSQTQGILWKKGRKDCRSLRGQEHYKKISWNQQTWAHRGTQCLNQQPTWK